MGMWLKPGCQDWYVDLSDFDNLDIYCQNRRPVVAEIFDAQKNVQDKFWQEKHSSSHEVIKKTLQNGQCLTIILTLP